MSAIIAGTTPTITYSFKKVKPSDITTAILTIKSRGTVAIEKDLSSATVTEDTISWTLEQAETLALGIGTVEIMLNWLDINGKRGVGKTVKISVVANHISEVMT